MTDPITEQPPAVPAPDPPGASRRLSAAVPGPGRPGRRARLARRGSARYGPGPVSRWAILGVWAAMAGVYAAVEPHQFLQVGTVQTIFGSQEALVFISLGLLATLIVNEFDLSFASMQGLAATLVPVLVVEHGWNPVAASAVAVLATVTAGAVNGFLVVKAGVDRIVVTLGMANVLLGLALALANLSTVSGLSPGFARLANQEVLGLPVSFYYGLAATLGFAYVLRFTPLGRHIAFVGANREVARLAGVRVDRIRFGSYVVSGLFSGIGGVLLVASVGGYDPTSSVIYLPAGITAVFLGMAAVRPGQFNPIGMFIGVYLLATGVLGLQLLGYTGWVEDVFYGAVLIIAVTVSALLHRRTT
jgi:ribose transport system permease protein